MKFIVPPKNQGQIVTVSFAISPDGVWMRVEDRSDNSVYYRLASWTRSLERWADSVGPQNSEPPGGRWGKRISEERFTRLERESDEY